MAPKAQLIGLGELARPSQPDAARVGTPRRFNPPRKRQDPTAELPSSFSKHAEKHQCCRCLTIQHVDTFTVGLFWGVSGVARARAKQQSRSTPGSGWLPKRIGL